MEKKYLIINIYMSSIKETKSMNQIFDIKTPKGRKEKKISSVLNKTTSIRDNDDEERQKAKREQTLASNKKRYHQKKAMRNAPPVEEEKEGEGITSSIKNAYNKTTKAIKSAKDAVVNTGNKALKQISPYVNAVVNGRDDYPPKVRNILNKYGNDKIKSFEIKRTEVPSMIKSALNAVSKGNFNKELENAPYDTIYHLFMEIILENGTHLSVEKNEVINMDINPKSRSNEMVIPVPSNNQHLTVSELMENAHRKQGGNFFKYSGRDNNCQDFILAIMQSNNIGNEDDYKFVKQDTKRLYGNDTTLRKVSNTLTDLGARANVVMNGAGYGAGDLVHIDLNSHNGKNYKMGEGVEGHSIVQSVVFNKSKYNIKEAKKWLKEHNYISPKVDEEKNTLRFRQIDPDALESEWGELNYITKKIKTGINLIIGIKKSNLSNIKNKMSKGGGIHFDGGVHHHHHIHIHKGDSDSGSDSDSDSGIKGGKLSKTSKAIIKGLKTIGHYAIPAATSALGAVAGEMIAPELGPVSGVAGSAAGSYAGNQINKKLGIGFGFKKGSQEAKEHMAKIRQMKGKK